MSENVAKKLCTCFWLNCFLGPTLELSCDVLNRFPAEGVLLGTSSFGPHDFKFVVRLILFDKSHFRFLCRYILCVKWIAVVF